MNIVVTVKPNSKRPGVELTDTGAYIVRVHEPAHEGKANLAVIKALAQFLDIAPSRFTVIRGITSKHKIIKIQ